MMAAVESEETQQKGLVSIDYAVGNLSRISCSPRLLLELSRLKTALPVRIVAMHYCYDDEKVSVIVNMAKQLLAKQVRARCRTHDGSYMECQYDLLTFGIPMLVLPLTIDGELKREEFSDWLKARESLEKSLLSTPENVESSFARSQHVNPTPNDVLFGRGRTIKDHPGNSKLHYLIEANRSRYEVAHKWEKTVIASEIVAIIKDSSGRFLRVDGNAWVEVDSEIAREKVSHTFRSRRSFSGSASLKPPDPESRHVTRKKLQKN